MILNYYEKKFLYASTFLCHCYLSRYGLDWEPTYGQMASRVKRCKVVLIEQDITRLNVDAIVNFERYCDLTGGRYRIDKLVLVFVR